MEVVKTLPVVAVEDSMAEEGPGLGRETVAKKDDEDDKGIGTTFVRRFVVVVV